MSTTEKTQEEQEKKEETKTTQEPNSAPPVEEKESELLASIKANPLRTEEEIKSLREENKSYRQNQKKLEEENQIRAKEEEEARHKKLEEDQQFTTLNQELKTKVDTLEKENIDLHHIKSKYEELEAKNIEILEAKLTAMENPDLAALIRGASSLSTVEKIAKAEAMTKPAKEMPKLAPRGNGAQPPSEKNEKNLLHDPMR